MLLRNWLSNNTKLKFTETCVGNFGNIDKQFISIQSWIAGDIRHLKQQTSPTDDGNRKRDISLETSLRMHNKLWPDVVLTSRTWERGFYVATRTWVLNLLVWPLLAYFCAILMPNQSKVCFMLKTMFWSILGLIFFYLKNCFSPCRTSLQRRGCFHST